MKIVHLSTTDLQGGAARSAYRLHQSLRNQNVDSSMLVLGKVSDDPSVVQFYPETALSSRVARMIRKERIRRAFNRYATTRPDGFEHFRDDRTEFGGELVRQLPSADLLHLHWVAQFIDFGAFFRKTPDVPIVWTLHDMNPFTGGCHFDSSCGRHTIQCGVCPQLGSARKDDLSHRIWRRKKKIFDQIPDDRLFFVAPSHWIARQARSSSLLRKFSTTVIPYGIDTELFRPHVENVGLRDALEIPRSARILLFVAEYTENRRKGFAFLDEALQQLKPSEPVFLLSIGNGTPKLTARLPHLHLGPIANDRLLTAIYNMADVFAIPSVQDNLPNTVLESMSCGTPVIGFDAGGIRDMVLDGETGFLAPTGNTAALTEALRKILSCSHARTQMAARSRERALKQFAHQLQANRYARLYEVLSGELKTAPRKYEKKATSRSSRRKQSVPHPAS